MIVATVVNMVQEVVVFVLLLLLLVFLLLMMAVVVVMMSRERLSYAGKEKCNVYEKEYEVVD